MRVWYFLTAAAAATFATCWFLVTEHLAAAEIDVLASRIVVLAIGATVLGIAGVEDGSRAIRARIERGRTIRTREAIAASGQVSVAADFETGALSRTDAVRGGASPPAARTGTLPVRPPSGEG
jgi:hypothetical protein